MEHSGGQPHARPVGTRKALPRRAGSHRQRREGALLHPPVPAGPRACRGTEDAGARLQERHADLAEGHRLLPRRGADAPDTAAVPAGPPGRPEPQVAFTPSRGAARYLVSATLSDGRKLAYDLKANCQAVRITGVSAFVSATVKMAIRGRGAGLVALGVDQGRCQLGRAEGQAAEDAEVAEADLRLTQAGRRIALHREMSAKRRLQLTIEASRAALHSSLTRTSRTGQIGLITRRSRVRIPPPLSRPTRAMDRKKPSVRPTETPRAACKGGLRRC